MITWNFKAVFCLYIECNINWTLERERTHQQLTFLSKNCMEIIEFKLYFVFQLVIHYLGTFECFHWKYKRFGWVYVMFFFSFLSNILLAFNECSDWELFRWRRCLLFIESVKYLDSGFSSLNNCKYDRSKFFLKVKKKNPKSCNMTYHTCFCIFPP